MGQLIPLQVYGYVVSATETCSGKNTNKASVLEKAPGPFICSFPRRITLNYTFGLRVNCIIINLLLTERGDDHRCPNLLWLEPAAIMGMPSIHSAPFASCTCRMMILLPRSPADVLYADLLMLSKEFVSMCNSVDSNSRTQSDFVWMIDDEFCCR